MHKATDGQIPHSDFFRIAGPCATALLQQTGLFTRRYAGVAFASEPIRDWAESEVPKMQQHPGTTAAVVMGGVTAAAGAAYWLLRNTDGSLM